MKSDVIQLRQEVFESDAWKIIDWLGDAEIVKYLNESQNVCDNIRQVVCRVNVPVLTHLFNQNGSFFMIVDKEEPVGYLKLIPSGKTAEMVVVIGEKEKWGKGLGSTAVNKGLSHVFFELRMDKVIAKINFNNNRSKRLFKKVGFKEEKELSCEIQYSITMEEFLKCIN